MDKPAMTAEQLEALSEAAAQAKATYNAKPNTGTFCVLLEHEKRFAYALADLYRQGQLILVDDAAVERVARAIKGRWDAAMQAEAEQSDGTFEYEEGPWEEWRGEAEAAIAAMGGKP